MAFRHPHIRLSNMVNTAKAIGAPRARWRSKMSSQQTPADTMARTVYPVVDQQTAKRRKELSGETLARFHAFSKQVFADGALPSKTKQLIAVAAAHVTQCPYCIEGHTKLAIQHGASEEEIIEAIWVAAEMRAGAAYAHSAIAVQAMPRSGSNDTT